MSESVAARPTPSVTGEVVRHVEQLIFASGLGPGDTLPSETELAATLGISRLSVREALRAMQARGLLEISQGRRPTIAHPSAEPLASYFSAAVRRDERGLFELLEVRLAVEVHVAALAAAHATRHDLAAIEAALRAMREAADDEALHRADLGFHAAVAHGSGNRLLSLLVEGMEEPLRLSRVESLRGNRRRHDGSLDPLIADHAAIAERIAARDKEGAAAAMRTHLLQTRADLRVAFSFMGDATEA